MACFCEQLPWSWIVGITGLTLAFKYIQTKVYLMRYYMQGGKYRKRTSASGKVVIVTGANTGIGKETVRELAKRGATIYMACRDMERCEKARLEIIAESGNKNIYAEKLDLASIKSIKEFADRFTKEQSRLNILINNAGVMMCPFTHTADGFEMQLGVNHIGHFLLTNLLLDLLKQSAPSRIVVVSSLAHKMGDVNRKDLMSEKSYSSTGAYGQSKLANILFTRELANRLKGTNVTVNALHPGAVESEIFRHFGFFKYPMTRLISKVLMWPGMKTTANGAQTTIYAALDPDLDNVSGEYFSDCKPAKVSKYAENYETAKWLWNETDRLVKLKLVQLGLDKQSTEAPETQSTEL